MEIYPFLNNFCGNDAEPSCPVFFLILKKKYIELSCFFFYNFEKINAELFCYFL